MTKKNNNDKGKPEIKGAASNSKFSLILGIVLLAAAIITFFYPTVANYVNSLNNRSQLKNYDNNVKILTDEEKQNYLEKAYEYNNKLLNSQSFESLYTDSDYTETLNFGDGLIGSIVIPSIDVDLPIYHGTDESVLSKGAAHLPNSSFPVGGKSTHSIISAHTAYLTQVFFDRLTELKEGDIFYIKILDDTYAYKVSEINVIEPDDTSLFGIQEGKDIVSLVTCTPYAVNTHRLVVTGQRVELSDEATYDEKTVQKVNLQMPHIDITFLIVIIITVVFAAFLIISTVIKQKKDKNHNKTERVKKNNE
ncbi:class C sortase [Ruminococcus bromii]|uniref:Class C sortase n=1 Tax=Ruminococcus bromii TaxID=40518 RepID=A0ABT0NHS1_9FIRM|nr:class C sortase [Ruminococcus bromii]